MSQDIIAQLQAMCDRLREKLMQHSEYRALMSLERTIQELSGCMDAIAPEEDLSQGLSMSQGNDHVADVLADALNAQPQSSAAPVARALDHLPSHRVA